MQHKLNLIALILFAAIFVGGCGLISSTNSSTGANIKQSANSKQAVVANKDLIDQAADIMFGDQKTNIPECDEALAKLESQVANKADDESTLDRVKREAVRQAVYKLVRDNLTDASTAQEKKQIGERCRQAVAEFARE